MVPWPPSPPLLVVKIEPPEPPVPPKPPRPTNKPQKPTQLPRMPHHEAAVESPLAKQNSRHLSLAGSKPQSSYQAPSEAPKHSKNQSAQPSSGFGLEFTKAKDDDEV